jgi:hypothetical protein
LTAYNTLLAAQQTNNKMERTKEKLTLSFDPEVRAAIKIEAVSQKTTASDLVLEWISPQLKKLMAKPIEQKADTVANAKKPKSRTAKQNKK